MVLIKDKNLSDQGNNNKKAAATTTILGYKITILTSISFFNQIYH